MPALSSVHWGVGCIVEIADVLDGHDVGNALIVTNKSLRRSPLLDQLRTACRGRVQKVVDIPAHVPRSAIDTLAHDLKTSATDVGAVISFGGGSTIDGAKALLATIGTPVLHLSVPTNLSGAELSSGYGVTEIHDGAGFKHSHRDPAVSPTVVFYDPQMTATTPPRLWAASGVKALDHAVEGLLDVQPLPVVSPLAYDGVHRLATSLESSVANLQARVDTQLAAWQCYFAPANVRYGLSHRLGHILGGTFGLPHGLTSAITLAPVVRATARTRSEKIRAIATALGADAGSADPADAAADRLDDLVSALGLPRHLRTAGLRDPRDLTHIAQLLRQHYPEAIAALGHGDEALTSFLEGLW
ncbi:iron-containing alcohol dehydrogenase [Catenulispora rubra]|uniref:iron-containing alcohol dehydrogenase n=1 Tax=Catenulispora rubra TaxID=280293 RepID=UPI0018924214|nr:iron-containing alcohol dehydrogenase [Catenulispora rubra]